MWLPAAHRPVPRPLPPARELAASVAAQVAVWASARVRSEEGLDALVLAAARAEERRWADASAEEAEVVAEVAEEIWGDLVAEAAQALVELDAA
jgi:hypothetical protein